MIIDAKRATSNKLALSFRRQLQQNRANECHSRPVKTGRNDPVSNVR